MTSKPLDAQPGWEFQRVEACAHFGLSGLLAPLIAGAELFRSDRVFTSDGLWQEPSKAVRGCLGEECKKHPCECHPGSETAAAVS